MSIEFLDKEPNDYLDMESMEFLDIEKLGCRTGKNGLLVNRRLPVDVDVFLAGIL